SEERARLDRVELSAAPPGLRPVLRRALSADPRERPTARSVADACLRVLERLSVEGPSPAVQDGAPHNGGGGAGPELGGTDGNGGVPLPEGEGNLPWLKMKQPFSDPEREDSGESPNVPGDERSRKRRFGTIVGRLIRACTPQEPQRGTAPDGTGGAGQRPQGAGDPQGEDSGVQRGAGDHSRPAPTPRHHLDRV